MLPFEKLVIFLLIIWVSDYVEGRRLCGPNQFRCRDGKRCIAALDVCDQESHCLDNSDENELFCAGNITGLVRTSSNECLPGMYRCRFGGCIEAKRICNGIPECYDGSDETEDLCKKNRCKSKKFRCHYGGCISASRKCDGSVECLDFSDEARKTCTKHVCPDGYFKCAYGGCIKMSKVCDNKRNCADNSDEKKELCEVKAEAEPTSNEGNTEPPLVAVSSLSSSNETKKERVPGLP